LSPTPITNIHYTPPHMSVMRHCVKKMMQQYVPVGCTPPTGRQTGDFPGIEHFVLLANSHDTLQCTS